MERRPEPSLHAGPRVREGDPDAPARQALARQKALATGLLVAMAVLMLGGVALAHAFPGSFSSRLLEASAKAGLVGGLADWFAVTALFRHPLGLPIPHTAILPAQKERLGRGLGNFVANHVFTEADIARALATIDLPRMLSRLLMEEETAALLAAGAARMVPHVLDGLEAGRAGELVGRMMPRLLSGGTLAPVVARALRALVDGDRHQEVLSFLLDQIKGLLKSREAHLHALIEERVREQGGRLVGWAIGGSIATRVLTAINAELERTDPRDSDLREAVTAWIRGEIDLIETDPQRGREISDTLRGLVTHDSIRLWAGDVWARARRMMEAELDEPDGWVHRLVGDSLRRLGGTLESDAAVRAAVDRTALALLSRALPAAREQLSGFIARVVAGWDTERLTERLELRVGRDLQFVRINGTLVGALVGGGLFLLTGALFGWGNG